MNKIINSNYKVYLIIFLTGIAVYFQSLFFGFTYFDDNVLVLENLFFLKDISNFFRAFTIEVFHVLHASAAYYRPMLTVSLMFDAIIGGDNPLTYHLTSLLIHTATACLLYLFLLKLKTPKLLALFWSLVFTVHPLLAQAVSWIPGRNDSLLGLFIFPVFIFFLEYLELKKPRSLFLHLLFVGLCFFTKESALLIPFMVFTLGLILYPKSKVLKAVLPLAMGYFLIFMVWFYLRSIALATSTVNYHLGVISKAIINNSPAVLLYLGKVLFPFNLTVLPILPDSTLWWGIAALVIIFLALAISKKTNYWLFTFGILWFLVFLLPAFIRPSDFYMPDFLEHRIYVPIIGLFISFSQLSFIKNLEFSKNWIKIPGVFILVALSLGNFYHNRKFSDKIIFWEDAAKKSPSHPLSHKNLGAMYYLDNRLDEARREFEKAVALSPTEPMIHNNLGLIYFRKQDYKRAEEEFFQELEYYPNYDNTFMNLGLLYYTQGFKEKARDMWLTTLKHNPDHKEALKSLAVYYATDEKDAQKANYFYTEALKRGVDFSK